MKLVGDRLRRLAAPMASDLAAVRRRGALVTGCLVLALAGLLARAHDIAVVHGDEFAHRAKRQQLRPKRLRPTRGEIVDRGHVALAVDDRMFRVVVNPRLVRAQNLTDRVRAGLLALLPDLDPERLDRELARDKAYRRLPGLVDEKVADAIYDARLPGVSLEPTPHRVYPRGHLAAHVVGRVQAEGRGQLGIEYALDEFLRGRATESPSMVARGRALLLHGAPDPALAAGHTVVLTLDSAIQAMAEEEIDTLVLEHRPVGASIVVLDPSTGEILALANRPTFDPNHPVPSIQQTRNLAVQAAYEPGSTMKAITVAAALDMGAIRPDETFYCEKGRWQATSEHVIRDTKPAEWLDVTHVLAMSSNICTAKIYERIGKRALYRWVRKFHFGERPPVRLPGATAGLLDPWEKWSDIQAANISFGQGMSASPLQVAAAFAALASEGIYRPPRIVRHVVDRDGNVVWTPEEGAQRLVRPATARTVLHMLEAVVESKVGTGKNARIPGYRVAGKTSTAQKASRDGGYAEDQYYASFVGAVPARAPRVVILVSVDTPEGDHYGNAVAAPTFARLGARIMRYMAVPPEPNDEDAVDATDGATDGRRPDRTEVALADARDSGMEPDLPGSRGPRVQLGVPDFRGLSMAEALELADRVGLDLAAKGSGIAVVQDPPPGPTPPDGRVRVLFEPPA
ncbi:MAG: hypothetical protein D6705_07040 [Deltaproteobacteria bacterium]|nr:MAG: hypothetical protein D6705_07040 [Deltaproteobacteria bacterium]